MGLFGLSLPKKKDLEDFWSRGWDQINTADAGRTWSQRTPVTPPGERGPRSLFGQATHNTFTDIAGGFLRGITDRPLSGFIVEPSRSLIADATRNKAAMEAAEERKNAALQASLPGMVANQIRSGAAATAAFPQAYQSAITGGPISNNRVINTLFNPQGSLYEALGGKRKMPSPQQQQAIQTGAEAYQQTVPSLLLSPVQDQLNRRIPTMREASQQAGYDVDASLSKKYLTDPALGILSAFGTKGSLNALKNPNTITGGFANRFRPGIAEQAPVGQLYRSSVDGGRPVNGVVWHSEEPNATIGYGASASRKAGKEAKVSVTQNTAKNPLDLQNPGDTELNFFKKVLGYDPRAEVPTVQRDLHLRKFIADLDIKEKQALAEAARDAGYDAMYVADAGNLGVRNVALLGPKTTQIPVTVKPGPRTSKIHVTRERKINVRQAPPEDVLRTRLKAETDRLTKSYEAETRALAKKPEITREYMAREIDSRYEQAFTKLIDDYENGRLPQRIPVKSVSSPRVRVSRQRNVVETGSTSPPTKKVNVAQSSSPEVAPSIEEAVTGKAARGLSTEGKGAGPIVRVTRKAQEKLSELGGKGLSSGKKLGYAPARAVQVVSGTFGKSAAQQSAESSLRGRKQFGSHLAGEVEKKIGDLSPESRARITALVDPEVGKARGVTNATPEEQATAAYIRKVYDTVHEYVHKQGWISDETYEANKGSYAHRSYADIEFEPSEVQQYNKANGIRDPKELLMRRKGMTEERANRILNDPVYNLGVTLDFVARKDAIHKYANWLSKQKNLVSDTPKTGYVKLSDSEKYYGDLAGKYIRQDTFEQIAGFGSQTKVLQDVYNVLNAYEHWSARRTAKKVRTIYDPGVRTANYLYSYVKALQGGVDPVSMVKGRLAAEKAIKSGDPIINELRRRGLLNTDITMQELRRQASRKIPKDSPEGVASELAAKIARIDKKLVQRYGNADDVNKMAYYFALTKKGVSETEAFRRTERIFQNYGSVGKAWDVSAKLPFFGKPFGRFLGDFIRTTTNTFVDHPLASIGLIAGFKTLQEVSSNLSGEENKDKKTREDRLGAGKFPGTNISTEVQTPWGAVDIRRFLGPVSLNDLGEIASMGGIEDILPFEMPIRKGKEGSTEVSGRGLGSDPLIGPGVQQIVDRDFRQLPITDPKKSENLDEPLNQEQMNKNRVDTAKRSYTPGLVNVGRDVVDAFRGKENFYGKKQSPLQAAARAVGVRVEQYGPEKAEKARDANEYFNVERKEIEAIKKKYLTDTKKQNLWDTLHPKTKDRFGKDIKDPQYRDAAVKAAIYLDNPDLFELDKDIAEYRKKTDGRPVDPLFRLDSNRRKTVLNIQAANAIDPKNNSARALTEKNPWLKDFYKQRGKYFDETKEFFAKIREKANSDDNPKNDMADEEREFDPMGVKYVRPSKQVTAKLDRLSKVTDKTERAVFYADNPDVSRYFKENDKYNRAKRAYMGLPLRDEFPTPSKELEKKLNYYHTLPKNDGPRGGSRTRSLWLQANPDVTDYWNKKAIYDLAQSGELAVFEGFDFDEDDAKDISSIARNSGSTGTGFSRYYGGGGGGSRAQPKPFAANYIKQYSVGGKGQGSGKVSVRKVTVKRRSTGGKKVRVSSKKVRLA